VTSQEIHQAYQLARACFMSMGDDQVRALLKFWSEQINKDKDVYQTKSFGNFSTMFSVLFDSDNPKSKMYEGWIGEWSQEHFHKEMMARNMRMTGGERSS
jgi:hypothetical protein